MEDTFFNKIKAQLEPLEAPFEPETWDLLERKMESLHSISEPIDQVVRVGLTNLEVPFDEATWASLADKLEAVENPPAVADVDKIVAKNLQNIEPQFEPEHWQAMSKKLDEVAARRRRMLFVKLAEAAIFLLLVWNLADVLPGGERIPGYIFSEKKAIAEVTPTSRSVEQQPTFIEKIAAAAENVLPNFSENEKQVQPSGNLKEVENLAQANFAGVEDSILKTLENSNGVHLPLRPQVNFAALEPLPTDIQLADFQKDKTPNLQKLTIQKGKTRQYYVSNFASVGRRKIQTPYDAAFAKAGYSQRTYSYGGGVAVGKRGKKWGAETGIAYTSMRYQPQKTIEITGGNALDGYEGIYLGEVDLDVVSVPMNVNRRLAKIGRAEVRASIGATANFAAQTAHRYRETTIPATSGNNFPSRTTGHEPGRGIFEGGKFSENTWLTADAGLRVEMPLGGRAAVFSEANFSKTLAGNVAPKNDRINGMNFSAGVLARL